MADNAPDAFPVQLDGGNVSCCVRRVRDDDDAAAAARMSPSEIIGSIVLTMAADHSAIAFVSASGMPSISEITSKGSEKKKWRNTT